MMHAFKLRDLEINTGCTRTPKHDKTSELKTVNKYEKLNKKMEMNVAKISAVSALSESTINI